MSTVKYQVFISSTYTDLKGERDEVIKAVLEMGHIPVGMEMFSAADEEQWKLIARQIDQSDYYIAIVAHRYGSVAGKKSYTEKEYDYAVQQRIPVLGFIIEDSAPWPSDRMENDAKKIKALASFKEKVRRKPVGFWSSAEELHGKVSIALMKLFNTNPRPGWIRASDAVGPEVVSEMSRLSSENAQLRKQLEDVRQLDYSHFAQGEDRVELKFNYIGDGIYKSGSIDTNWDELYQVVGRASLEDPGEVRIEQEIRGMVKEHLENIGKFKNITQLFLEVDEMLKIKTQFIALGFIEVKLMTRHGTRTYTHPHWILTDLGQRKLVELLAIHRD